MSNDLRLDGNAAAGILGDVFPFEMTTNKSTCKNCGATDWIGAVHVYMKAPGVVLRCPSCEAVLIRIVRGRDRIYVDLQGVRRLDIVSMTT